MVFLSSHCVHKIQTQFQGMIPVLTIPPDSNFCSLFVFSSMAFCWLAKLSWWLVKLCWSPLTLASNWLKFHVSLCRVVTNLFWKWNVTEIWCRLTKIQTQVIIQSDWEGIHTRAPYTNTIYLKIIKMYLKTQFYQRLTKVIPSIGQIVS